MKWAGFAVFFLAALGAWAMGFGAASAHPEVEVYKLPRLQFRALPAVTATIGTRAEAVTAKPTKPTEVAAAPVKEVEPPASAPEPAKEEPVKAEPIKAEPARVAPPPPPPPAPKAAQVAARPPAAAPTPVAAATPTGESTEGTINLKASDTAEVVIDGRKVGPSPRLGVKLKAGKHKVRFDCYDENGNLKAGKVQTVEVLADAAQDIDFECPVGE